MKPDTIIHAFEESGCWPISAKQGIKKMRSYSRRQSTATDLLDLPALPPTPAEEIAKLEKAERALALAISRYTADIKTKGIQARKDEKARKLRLRDVELAGGLVDLPDLIPIREPDKHPTVADTLFTTPEGHPSLLNNLRELQHEEISQPQGGNEDEVNIFLNRRFRDREEVQVALNLQAIGADASDTENDNGSVDSISRNASFVGPW